MDFLTSLIAICIAVVLLCIIAVIDKYGLCLFKTIRSYLREPENKARYVLVHHSDGLECTFFKDIESANIEMCTQYYLILKNNIETELCGDISKIIPNEFAILSDDDDNIHVWEIFKIPEVVM